MSEMMNDMQERQAIARRVTSALRYPSGRKAFGIDECAETNIIIALPTDTCENVFHRTASAGRPATVVMPTDDGLHVATFRAVAPGTPRSDGDTPIHPAAHISMLIDYITKHRGGKATRCSIEVPGGVLECSDAGPVMIPA